MIDPMKRGCENQTCQFGYEGHMGDSTQPQQKSAGAGESSDFGAIRAGPSQMATFMPFWI